MKFMFKSNSAIRGGCILSCCRSEIKAVALDLGRIADGTGGDTKYTSDTFNIPKDLR